MSERVKVNYAIPVEAVEKLGTLCKMDQRSLQSDEIAWLIEQEWARRFSQPNLISVEEAMKAGA